MNAIVATHTAAMVQRVVKVDRVIWHVQTKQLRCVVAQVQIRFLKQIVQVFFFLFIS
jgi:hypothetical protein